MPERASILRLGTRGSRLARWQTDYVASLITDINPGLHTEIVVISTRGDEIIDKSLPTIGGKGLFTEALEAALRAGTIDCAVHSLKDLPTAAADGIITAAIPARADVRDVLISRSGSALAELPDGATIGTSSLRRAAQLRAVRPDLRIIDIRGNIETRIEKTLAADGPYAATVLALAGIQRLGLRHHVSEILPLDLMLPAPGQGALAVQCRDDDTRHLIAGIMNDATHYTVSAERAFLQTLEGGCSVPVAAFAEISDDVLVLRGRVIAVDGSTQINVDGCAELTPADPTASLAAAAGLGRILAVRALSQGAAELLPEQH